MTMPFDNCLHLEFLSFLSYIHRLGKTYELAGPEVLTEKQLADWVSRMLKIKPRMVELGEEDLWYLPFLSTTTSSSSTTPGPSLRTLECLIDGFVGTWLTGSSSTESHE